MMRLLLAVVAAIVLVLGGVIGYRTATFAAPPPPPAVELPALGDYAINTDAAAQRLAEAIRFRTISIVDGAGDPAQFQQFQAWMQARYPAFHAAAKREAFGGLSLLYTWEGSDPGQPPMLLMAHQDVVPTPADTLEAWSVDPFAGVIRDQAIWGRGAIDDKASLVALLEAAEFLAAQGRRPQRTILFAFGHDEEIGGAEGAQKIAAALQQRGVRVWFALDEGMAALAEHPLTGGPASMIGIAEKGFATLRVRAEAMPGHSSMPPPETAVSALAEAVDRIHEMPIERRLEGGPALAMMRALGPELPVVTRTAIANEWLLGPLIHAQMADNRAALALIGTTVAPTMINAGVRPNVLPGEAVAMINFRLHPRDTADEVLAEARAAAAGIEALTIDWAEPPLEASAVSSTTSSSYALLAALARAALPDAPVAPGLVLGGTDSRHYGAVAENVYRFMPILLTNEDLEGFHGIDEKLSIANLERTIRFYIGLMEAGAM
jgi:carboxypeptidase PM20D1